jgi:hypothetical protein
MHEGSMQKGESLSTLEKRAEEKTSGDESPHLRGESGTGRLWSRQRLDVVLKCCTRTVKVLTRVRRRGRVSSAVRRLSEANDREEWAVFISAAATMVSRSKQTPRGEKLRRRLLLFNEDGQNDEGQVQTRVKRKNRNTVLMDGLRD